MELVTGENDKGRRLDRILRKALPDYPLPLIHRLLRQKKVLVNGTPAKGEDRLESGSKIDVPEIKNFNKTTHSSSFCREPLVCNIKNTKGKGKSGKEDLKQLEILWEDSGLIAVNKPAGISVHGPDSLDTQVRSFLCDKLPPSLSFTPGPLHRLDKPSSGIVVFSSSIEGARLFTSLMREKKVRKTYLVIVEGNIKNEQIWRDSLLRDKEIKKTFIAKEDEQGKNAVTKVTPLSVNGNYTLIKAEIETGRTHQIRAQAASHGHPVAGDVKYGGKKIKGDIFLHAWKLEFLQYVIEAPIPKTGELVTKFQFLGQPNVS